MTAMGGTRRRGRLFGLGLIGILIAAALALGHGAAPLLAAESGSAPVESAKPKPPKAVSAKKKTTTGKSKPKSAAKKKKSTAVAKAKHPLPPPRRPAALANEAGTTEPAKTDVATSLDKGVAEVVPTTSRNAKPAEKAVPPAASTGEAGAPAEAPAPEPPSVAPKADTAVSPAEPKVAAAPPAPAVTLTKESLRIQFAPGAADLPESAAPSIGELAALMSREQGLRLQLLAFAAGTKETASQSRRLSLNRALAVRGALIDAGVRSTRIDVRALGNQTEESPSDRVDILVMQRGGG